MIFDKSGDDVRLRVVTLNVWNDQGDQHRIGVINGELRILKPDLVAFQEVLHTSERNQLDDLLDGTGLHGTQQHDVLAPSPKVRDGIAVATQWPHQVLEVAEHTVAVSVPIPDLGDILFIGVAASYELDDETARERQAVTVSDVDERHRRALPTIIAGDFNAVPEAASIRYLTGLRSLGGRSAHYHDAWEVAGDGDGHTWSCDNPNARIEIDRIIRQPNHRRRIDYVFVGSWHAHPSARAEVRRATLAFERPVEGIWASDHYGVMVDLDLDMDA
jgi:endonuclease/exonuclease/phosphatase family metal-dependent hydrolase